MVLDDLVQHPTWPQFHASLRQHIFTSSHSLLFHSLPSLFVSLMEAFLQASAFHQALDIFVLMVCMLCKDQDRQHKRFDRKEGERESDNIELTLTKEEREMWLEISVLKYLPSQLQVCLFIYMCICVYMSMCICVFVIV